MLLLFSSSFPSFDLFPKNVVLRSEPSGVEEEEEEEVLPYIYQERDLDLDLDLDLGVFS